MILLNLNRLQQPFKSQLILCLMKFKFLSLSGLLLLISLSLSAQKTGQARIDSLFSRLSIAKEDTNKVNLLRQIGSSFTNPGKTDSAFFYLGRSLQLSEKIRWENGIAKACNNLGFKYYEQSNYTIAQNYLKKAVDAGFIAGNYVLAFESARLVARAFSDQNKTPSGIRYLDSVIDRFKKTGSIEHVIALYVEIGGWYQRESDYDAASGYFSKAQALLDTNPDKYTDGNLIINIAVYYIQRRQYNKARQVLLKGEAIFKKTGDRFSLADDYDVLSECFLNERKYPSFVEYARKAAQIAEKIKNNYVASSAENSMGWGYYLMKKYDSAYIHTKRAFLFVTADSSQLIRPISTLGSIYREATPYIMKDAGLKPGQQYQKSVELLIKSVKFGNTHTEPDFANENQLELSLTYKKMHRYADALDTYQAYIAGKNKLDSSINEKATVLREAQLNYSHKEDSLKYKENITNAQLKQKKQQSYFFIAGIAALVLLSVFIWRNFNNQRKSNKLLADANHQLSGQREEITTQRDQLSDTLANLKSTQQQLIQSEKMASLGELTAGIAHEIQNPLNFVNNFSEVSRELLTEMKEELAAGHMDDVADIADSLDQNLQKINHHGRRADNIVKGMLEHSRTSTGQKTPTDVNKLADEYLRLAYHGLRAKDKTFNAELITHFDPDLSPINVIPQDIGRVLLNLFNNAFYATQQKQKITDEDYKPTVELTTLLSENNVVIKVKDNGTGIPASIKEKVMQPFFTTKPTGEGTGLGLSLSYDIVVKGHGGNIDVNSTAGEGAEFMIQIPYC
jgi:two-component system NtrC family sensor kinase